MLHENEDVPLEVRLDDPRLNVHHTRVAQHLARLGRLCTHRVVVRVELGETLDELVARIDALELRRNERLRVDGLVTLR